MLAKIAKVGNGVKWHIFCKVWVTYCGAKPGWVSDTMTEIGQVSDLCANCKRKIWGKIK